jgi:hypothetical protein
VDACQAVHYPGWGSFTIGPGKDQGVRKYKHLLPFVIEGGVIGGKELDHISRSIHSETEYKTGSMIEIALGGGVDNANGPRQPRLHRDEIELMLDATRKQAVNIPAGKRTRDGRYVPAQTVDTSTMKYAGGYVDLEMEAYYKKLRDAGVDPTEMDPIEAFHLAVSRGHRPRKLMLVSCVYEIAAENPTCRSVPDHERQARLIELGRDPDEICDCHTYESDVWDTDDPAQPTRPRTLEDACQGRFFRSRGYQEFGDIQTFFLDNDRATWEAEKECSQPSREGAYLKSYSQDRHGIRGYEPDPENGPIYTTTDWGTTDEHATLWIQILEREVRTTSYKGESVKVMQPGSWVVFAEFVQAHIGNVKAGQEVQAKELEWFLRWPGWRPAERHSDNANPGAITDWRDLCGMTITNRIKKDFPEEVKLVRTRIGGWSFFIDIPACQATDKALRGWRQINGREVRNEHTHCFPAGTLVETNCGARPIEIIRAGEFVWTRAGCREVTWAGQTGTSEIIVVEHEQGRIECTPEHLFWTQRGWIAACELRPECDMLLRCSSKMTVVDSLSSIEAIHSHDGSTPMTSVVEPTSRALLMDERPTCIVRYGEINGVRYQMDLRSIIRTSIPTTTLSEISQPYQMQIIDSHMSADRSRKLIENISIEYVLLLLRRWVDQMYEKLVENAVQNSGKNEKTNTDLTYAINALRSSLLTRYTHLLDFARTIVRVPFVEQVELIMRRGSVSGVEVPGWSIVIPELSSAPTRVLHTHSTKRVENVYDLSVEDHHEFIAEGVLVHNSMACLRYFAHERHVVDKALVRAGSEHARPVAADDERVRPREREAELERGIRVIRHGPSRGRDSNGVAGAEDSPLRSHSDRISRPGDLREAR